MREIHYAAARGDLETVLEELRSGVDVNHQDPDALGGGGGFDLASLLEGEEFDWGEHESEIQELASQLDAHQFGELEETPLIVAAGDARAGVAMLECLLDHGADVNRMGGGVETCALGAAIRGGDLGKVRLLISRGADPAYVTRSGTGAWVDAAYCRADSRHSLVRLLSTMSVADPGLQTRLGEHAATVVARRGDFAFLQTMLRSGLKPDILAWTPLMEELVHGTEEGVRGRLGAADLGAMDALGRSVWLLSATVGDVGKMKLLFEAGVDVMRIDPVGRNALHLAAEGDHVNMIRWLIDRGMKPDARTHFGETALLLAAESGAAAAVRVLLELGADPTLETETGRRAICEAANLACVRALQESGEDINYIGGDGCHLLKTAAEMNDIDMVRGLIGAGADPNNGSTGATALHTAISCDHLEPAGHLLAAGADPSRQDVDGWSVLHYCRSRRALKMIVEADVDLALTNDVGHLAGESFVAMGRPDLAAYLDEIMGH